MASGGRSPSSPGTAVERGHEHDLGASERIEGRAQLARLRSRLVGGQHHRSAGRAGLGGREREPHGGVVARAVVGEQDGTELRAERAVAGIRRHDEQRPGVRLPRRREHVAEHREHERGARVRRERLGESRLRRVQRLHRDDHASLAVRGHLSALPTRGHLSALPIRGHLSAPYRWPRRRRRPRRA